MFNNNGTNIFDYNSTIYICKKLGTTQDENLNQIEIYDKPIKCRFNVQSVEEDSEIREFGEMASSMKVALVIDKNKYMNKFKEFDKTYIDTIPSNDEVRNGQNADYRIYSVRPQNTCILIYFKKITK